MKRGSAILYVIFAALITGMIISFAYTRIANVQISHLDKYNKMKEIYERDIDNISSVI